MFRRTGQPPPETRRIARISPPISYRGVVGRVKLARPARGCGPGGIAWRRHDYTPDHAPHHPDRPGPAGRDLPAVRRPGLTSAIGPGHRAGRDPRQAGARRAARLRRAAGPDRYPRRGQRAGRRSGPGGRDHHRLGRIGRRPGAGRAAARHLAGQPAHAGRDHRHGRADRRQRGEYRPDRPAGPAAGDLHRDGDIGRGSGPAADRPGPGGGGPGRRRRRPARRPAPAGAAADRDGRGFYPDQGRGHQPASRPGWRGRGGGQGDGGRHAG